MKYNNLLKQLISLTVVLWPSLAFAGLQNVPEGSLIIPMDNINQAIVPAGQAPFNLKAYGLVNQFLQNGIPVRWAIKEGKSLNDIDFTAQVERIAPSLASSTTIDFRGGPFIVPDTVLPCGLTTRQIIQAFGNNVVVYRLATATQIDIKHVITHHPKVAVFNNGGNQLIHTKILDAAGIKDYVIMDAADIDELKHCFTFASEPHAEEDEVSIDVINGVKEFVMIGGNFLAQCHAIGTYENRGFFQTTGGIVTVNTNVTHKYDYADQLYSQIHGVLQENEGGSISNFTLQNGSNWISSTNKTVSYQGRDTVIATEAHLIAPNATGGNVYYLGGHDYGKAGKGATGADLSTIAKVNALRMYLNAVFVPSGNTNGAWANAGPSLHTVSCNDSVVLGCTQTGPLGATFLWTPAAGLSCTTCPNPIAKPLVTTTYKVLVTNGCTAIDTVKVIVGPKPVAQYTNNTVCIGATTNFTDQSTSANFWNWNFGDPDSGVNNTSVLQNPTHLFGKAGTYTVTLISGTSVNCADTSVRTVVVNALPVLTANAPVVCQGQKVVIKVNGADAYLWSIGGTADSLVVVPTTTTTYSVTGTSVGCKSTLEVVVKVAPTMVPSTTAEVVSCAGGSDGTASVSIQGGIAPFVYAWNSNPVQTTPKAIGLAKGSYTVTIRDSAGCKASATVAIVEPLPIVLITKASPVSCPSHQDGSVEVIAQGGNGSYVYAWNTVPPQFTAELKGLGMGTYEVKVTDAKSCTDTAVAIVTEPVHPQWTLSATDVRCHGSLDGKASILVQGGNAGYSFSWNSSPLQNTAEATALGAGTYVVMVQDAHGCKYRDSIIINQPLPLKLALNGVLPSCIQYGSATVLAQGGVGKYTFLWDTSPAQSTATAVHLPPGVYKVQVADSNGCTKDSSIYLPAPTPPIADFNFNNVCLGASATQFWDRSGIPVGTGELVSRIWDFGDLQAGVADTSTANNPTYSYGTAGSFNVTLITITQQGCADTIVKRVEVYPLPIAKLEGTGEGCGSVCVDFKDGSSISQGTIRSWLWSFGGSHTSAFQNPSHCYAEEGSHDVALKVVSDKGCVAFTKSVGVVKVRPNPKLALNPLMKACYEGENAPATLLDAGLGTTYLWQPSGETTRYISVKGPGLYRVTVGNSWKCETTAAVEVKQVCPPRLFVANAFSPNGDGTNDMYTVYSAHVGTYQMLIFNRWGEIIFESRDRNHHWDGIYRGEPMPVGVYAWIITYEGDSEEYRGPYKKEGSVTVVR